ncbi:hypothetical protein DSC45_22105 [Streptomyces sp. YIM 130001]|nr:hypothetical protein DSC45_22105 [Streptomyces sp. YIM 130001]
MAEGEYKGSSAEELAAKKRGDRIAAGVDQSVLFPRRGSVLMTAGRLVLTDWGGSGDLTLRPGQVVGVERKFTDLYGRFVGGLLDSGKPLILETTAAGKIYLLVNHKTFMETTDNKKWEKLINQWRAGGR